MFCVMCLFNNPAGTPRCLRCGRAAVAVACADADDGRVTLEPELRIVVDDDTELQLTENCQTLDFQVEHSGRWACLPDPEGEPPLRKSASPPARG